MNLQNGVCDQYQKKPYESYQAYVAARTRRNPCLRNLSKFLISDKSRQKSCQIACLEFSSLSGVTVHKSLDLGALVSLLGNKTKGIRGRLLIVEDLSIDVVETLGSALNLDPFFFASHIDVGRVDLLGPKRLCTATLPSKARTQNFLNIPYHRVLEFEHSPPQSTLFRDMNIVRKVKILPSNKGVSLGLARHCCSILQVVEDNGPWIGKRNSLMIKKLKVQAQKALAIILVDVCINDSFWFRGPDDSVTTTKLQVRPFQDGFEGFDSGASFLDGVFPEHGLEQRSLLGDLIFYWGNEMPEGFDVKRPTLISLSYYPLKIIAAEWIMYSEVMFYSRKQHEYAPNSVPAALKHVALLNTDLSSLQTWARRSMATSHKLHDVIRFLKYQRSQDRDVDCCTLLIEDYEHIALTIDTYSRRLEAMVPVVTSMIQIVDSQQALKVTANIARLTYLALVFMPLTFVSGLFSMNDHIKPGGREFWVYLVVAIPVSIIVFFVARPPRRFVDFIALWSWKLRRSNLGISRKATIKNQ